jgi:hypothetical protein
MFDEAIPRQNQQIASSNRTPSGRSILLAMTEKTNLIGVPLTLNSGHAPHLSIHLPEGMRSYIPSGNPIGLPHIKECSPALSSPENIRAACVPNIFTTLTSAASRMSDHATVVLFFYS